jgi:hypothetical protein
MAGHGPIERSTVHAGLASGNDFGGVQKRHSALSHQAQGHCFERPLFRSKASFILSRIANWTRLSDDIASSFSRKLCSGGVDFSVGWFMFAFQ